MSSSCSFALLIARLPQESGLMLVHSTVGLECRIVVVGHTLSVLCLCRVVADRCCMLEYMYDPYSSKIMQAAKDCYCKHGYNNNSGMNSNSLVFLVNSALLESLVYAGSEVDKISKF